MTRAAIATLAFVLLLPPASGAQVSVRGFGDFGFTVFNATQSFKAILGNPSGPVFGGGAEFGEKQLFLSPGAQRFRRAAPPASVFPTQLCPPNVKDTITGTPLHLTCVYRLRS